MSDFIKWGLLAVLIVAAIVTVIASPPVQAVLSGSSDIGTQLTTIITTCGTYISFGRCIINNFLSPVARGVLTGLIAYLFLKPIILFGYKSITMFIKFIYK